MTISRNEFLRSLPGAVGGGYTESADGRFSGPAGVGTWTAHLAPMDDLRIAGISLERHRVTLRVDGLAADALRAFLARWEVHFRRGGG